MSLDRVLAIVGVVLSLPGFIALFLKGYEAVVVVAIVLGLVLLLASWVIYRHRNLPAFDMKSIDVVVDIKDSAGDSATLSKRYRFRPNFDVSQRMNHRNIAADGSVDNICWNGEAVPADQIKERCGEYQVEIDLGGPLSRHKYHTGELSYDAVGSFKDRSEALIYVADFKTKITTLTIKLPTDRPCKSAKLYRVRGAEKKLLDPPDVNGNNCKIEVSLKKPAVGAEYELWWDW